MRFGLVRDKKGKQFVCKPGALRDQATLADDEKKHRMDNVVHALQ